MSLIKINVIDQQLQIVEKPLIATGDVNTDVVQWTFDSTWNGYGKVAVFYQNPKEVYHSVVNSSNMSVIPKEALREVKTLHIGVFGVRGDNIITSQVLRYKIVEGAITSDTTPTDPSPDLWQQILEKFSLVAPTLNEMSELAHNVNVTINEMENKIKNLDSSIFEERVSALEGDRAKTDLTNVTNETFGAKIKACANELDAGDFGAIPLGDKPKVIQITLEFNGWYRNEQIINGIVGVLSNNAIIVSPSANSHKEYCECSVRCTAQSVGSLTFVCDRVPNGNLVVNLLVMGVQ